MSGEQTESGEVADRGFWDTRAAFWLAASGSAVGLGNLWRFPWQVYTWGGGAFLVAYFICLFAMGMPLLTQEMALGKMFRGGDVEAYGRISPRLRGIGLASVVGVFAIVCYYSTIISWSLRYFFASFADPLPWTNYEETCAIIEPKNANNSALKFWHCGVLGLSKSISESTGDYSLPNAGCCLIVWIVIYLSVMYGVKSMSKVVMFSMPVPILILVVMLIRGAMLEGAGTGVEKYLSTDISMLSNLGLWNAAVGQMFFSLSICMGVMTAYASYTESRYSLATDEKVVAFCDVGVAFLSGFVIYTILGFLSTKEGEGVFEAASMGLVFVSFPTALAQLKAAQLFSVLFFFTLFLLGIDSAFSMVEAVSTVMLDLDRFSGSNWLSRPKLNGMICIVGFLLSLLFCFDSGLYWLDILDRFINNYGMLFIGMIECMALGWVYKWSDQVAAAGSMAVNVWGFCYWGGLFVGTVVGMAPVQFVVTNAEKCQGFFNYGELGFGLGVAITAVIWIAGAIVSVVLAGKYAPEKTMGQNMWAVFGWHGAEVVREYVNKTPCPDFVALDSKYEVRAVWDISMLNVMWGWQIKYFIPTMLFLLEADICRTSAYMRYGCYNWEHLALGIFTFVMMIVAVIVVGVMPSCMAQEWDNQDESSRQKKVGVQLSIGGANDTGAQKTLDGAI